MAEAITRMRELTPAVDLLSVVADVRLNGAHLGSGGDCNVSGGFDSHAALASTADTAWK
jgi:hypothetical protein